MVYNHRPSMAYIFDKGSKRSEATYKKSKPSPAAWRSQARTILVFQFVLEPWIPLDQVHTSEHINTLFHFNPRYAELTEKQADAPFHAGFPHRDLLPAECLAQEISLALPVEVSRFLYPPDLAFRRIIPLGDFLRVKPRTSGVFFAGNLQIQGVMRAFIVVKCPVCVKLPLRVRKICDRGMFQELLRHGAVEALLLPLRLGVGSTAMERQNPQFHKPNLEPGKAGALGSPPGIPIVAKKGER